MSAKEYQEAYSQMSENEKAIMMDLCGSGRSMDGHLWVTYGDVERAVGLIIKERSTREIPIEEVKLMALKLGYRLTKGYLPKFKDCPKCGYSNKAIREWGPGFNTLSRICPRCKFMVTVERGQGMKDYQMENQLKILWNTSEV